ncbi:GAF and ANTAR domain-containing protein [Isoptericola halotolerans]|uniref:GAF and ANTAR domain-containing protein n=1 Tax=Isoptericola halotolerans TaxID=300560 RepID=UPI003890A1E2
MAISRYLEECATRAAGMLDGDLEASLTMRQYGMTLQVGSSARGAARCDQREAMADAGPCVEAMATGAVVEVASVARDDRWPPWRRQALDEGFVRALAVPSDVAPGIVVALNLYARDGGTWDERFVSDADAYARLIASAVRLQLKFADLDDAAGSLLRSTATSTLVERAVGAVMQTNDCSREAAAELMRSAATECGIPEREVATTILRSLLAPGTGDIVDERSAGT